MTPVSIGIRPTREHIERRISALAGEHPELIGRLARLQEFNHGIRTAEVFLTVNCNIRCQGCWYYENELDRDVVEIRDPVQIRAFAQRLRDEGVTHVLLIGGEPTIVPERVRIFSDVFPYVSIVTNGARPLPMDGFENVTIAASVFGGGPLDDRLRAIRPNGSRFQGLFDSALAGYRGDPRVVWIYALSEPGIPFIEETVRKIATNGNLVNFGFYSAYGQADPVRLREGQALLEEALRVRKLYPDVVLSQPYYLRTLVSGEAHFGSFGYETCAAVSVDHPAHADRLTNGNPVVTGFNAYRPDHQVQFCCTSGNCAGCRDSQAIYSWLLVNMHRFLETAEQLRTWVEIAESFYRQYRWSPYRRADSPIGCAGGTGA